MRKGDENVVVVVKHWIHGNNSLSPNTNTNTMHGIIPQHTSSVDTDLLG